MLTAMVAGFYDSNEMYNGTPSGTEFYTTEVCFGLQQDNCATMPCAFHGVRMMNNNMAMALPPGHVVQQVVDENGTLLHVVLSPVPLSLAGPYNPASSAAQHGAFYGYPPPPTYPPPPPYHAHLPTLPGPTITPSNHLSSHKGSSPPLLTAEDRRQYLKFKKRSESRPKDPSTLNNWVVLASPSHSPKHGHYSPQFDGSKRKGSNGLTNGYSESHKPRDEEEIKLITKILSSIQPPTISEITTTSALVQWSYPDLHASLSSPHGFIYEVLVADNEHEGQYKIAYSGSQLEYRLQNLTPSTTYHVSVQTLYSELRGSPSQEVIFETSSANFIPQLATRTKTSLTLAWEKSLGNILEWDEGAASGDFVELYNGDQGQYKANRLQPATSYRFRLKNPDQCGNIVSYSTSGGVPAKPLAPSLKQAYIDGLHLEWAGRPVDETFFLDIDECNGWQQVYMGKEMDFLCSQLTSNTEYRFRLCAQNEQGFSNWSDEVSYFTLPLRPPGKPYIEGRPLPTSLRFRWEPSEEPTITHYVLQLDKGQGYEPAYTGPETECVLDNLEPVWRYGARVCSCQGYAMSEFSEVTVFTTSALCPSKCDPPKLDETSATATCTTTSGLKLIWEPPRSTGGAPISQYQVCATQSADSSVGQVYQGQHTWCQVTDVEPKTNYLFQVRALNGVGPGPWSEPLEVTTGIRPPQTPTSLTAEYRDHSVIVNWASGGDVATSYKLELSRSEKFTELYVGPETKYILKEVEPASLLFFRVLAINEGGLSPFSSEIVCEVPARCPSSIQLVKVKSSCTSTTIRLSWDEPFHGGSLITHYAVEVDGEHFQTDTSQLLLEELLPETTYRFTFVAFNAMGQSEKSDELELVTLSSPPSPPMLECLSASHSSLRLRWGCGRSPTNLVYTLEMANKWGSFSPMYQGIALNHKVGRLQENTEYKFRVCASTVLLGAGPYSEVVTFCTAFTPPPAMKAPRISEVTNTSCNLDWTAVKCTDQVSYHLQLIKKDSITTVYQGPLLNFKLNGLEPKTSYHIRVGAVRHLATREEEISGPFSPGAALTTHQTISPPLASLSNTPVPQTRTFTDQHYAIALLVAFFTVGVLIAIVLQYIFNTTTAAT